MNRKAIIACIAALAALAVLVAAAVFFLYSGTEETKTSAFASEGSTGLLAAVPSDAVMVAGFSDMKSACSLLTDTSGCFHYFTGGKESSLLLKFLEKAEGTDHGVLKSSRAVLSLHYNGSLVPLLVIDAGRAGSLADGKAAGLIALADSAGLSVLLPDCPETADENTYLHRRDIILLSTSDVQTKSAERHIAKGISVLDSEGFADCLRQAGEVGNTVFLSCGEAGKFFAGIARKGLSGYADFLKKFAGWASFSIDDAASDHLRLSGRFTSDSGAEDFINVFRGYSPARSSVGTVLPSYTVFFASLPLDDVSSYITCADAFADGTGKLGKTELARKQLQKRSGLSPVQWARTLDVKEVAAAFFKVGGRIEKILLMKIGNKDMSPVFRDTGQSSGKGASPKLCDYPYAGFASSVFGPFFSLPDESSFTYIDGWIIAGSRSAVSEYVDGRALENTLAGYAEDASIRPDFMTDSKYFVSYLSVSEGADVLQDVFTGSYARTLAGASEGYSYVPVTFCISEDKDDNVIASAETFRVSSMKTKAPVFERDTVVVVPKGPFEVKNSGTGKMNLFYQQDNMYLCLKEVGGKGLWGVPFSSPICGNAGTIDYFANGKLQILFASGSKLYLIDRLGRYVNPFPVDLGKEILLGPGIYDFNGNRRYNVMILHKDNTIEMYNLQGRRPAQWKGIAPAEKIKGLPEAVKTGGKTFWVVRTSIQTLIYGFYGGEPLTVFEGDRMIRSDSKVIPGEGMSVKAVCYDGKTHTIKLK